MEQLKADQEEFAVAAGETRLEFRANDDDPFYHFAILAPGNRFPAALAWLQRSVPLLPDRSTGEVDFEFGAWAARACYFHDPAGNIVELIAHRGMGETSKTGSFTADELLGLSELGLVGYHLPAMARALEQRLALRLWDGTVAGAGSLAFVGEKGRTLILCPAGRPWLPTGRPAESHPVEATASGPPEGEVLLCGGRFRIARTDA
jgi:catechol 2,3-dioxygenase-like lactoylglutathione lyase family enzyme